jgi:lysophospholipase L1-like esterase
MEEQYTIDGVHLLKNGYEKWGEIIMPIMENY